MDGLVGSFSNSKMIFYLDHCIDKFIEFEKKKTKQLNHPLFGQRKNDIETWYSLQINQASMNLDFLQQTFFFLKCTYRKLNMMELDPAPPNFLGAFKNLKWN